MWCTCRENPKPYTLSSTALIPELTFLELRGTIGMLALGFFPQLLLLLLLLLLPLILPSSTSTQAY